MGLVVIGEEKVAVVNPTNVHHAWQSNIKVDLTDHGIALPLTMSVNIIVDRLNGREGTFNKLMENKYTSLMSTPACVLWAGDNDLYYLRVMGDNVKEIAVSPIRRTNRFIAVSTDTEVMLKANMFIDQNPDATLEEIMELVVNHTDTVDDISYHNTSEMKKAVENWNA